MANERVRENMRRGQSRARALKLGLLREWNPYIPPGWAVCERCDLLTRNGALCGWCVAEVALGHPAALMGIVEIGPPDDRVRDGVTTDGHVTYPRGPLSTSRRRALVGNVWQPTRWTGVALLDDFGGEPYRPSRRWNNPY